MTEEWRIRALEEENASLRAMLKEADHERMQALFERDRARETAVRLEQELNHATAYLYVGGA